MGIFDRFKKEAKGAPTQSDEGKNKTLIQPVNPMNVAPPLSASSQRSASKPADVQNPSPSSDSLDPKTAKSAPPKALSDDEWQELTGGSFFVGKEGIRFVRLDGLEALKEFAQKEGMQEAKDVEKIAQLAKEIQKEQSVKKAGFTFRMGGIATAKAHVEKRIQTPRVDKDGVEELVFPTLDFEPPSLPDAPNDEDKKSNS